jgi:hypothetical protein
MSYTFYMTLSGRNTILKGSIALSSVFLFILAASSARVIAACPDAAAAAFRRSAGFGQLIGGKFFETNPYGAYISIIASVLYSFTVTIIIYYFFEKTQSPEILFFAFFALSFGFESMRIVAPLNMDHEILPIYLMISSRLLLFGRYAGIFSLFAASIYAAGFQAQQQRITLFVIVVATLIIALGVPVDTLSWDTSFSMISGFLPMFRLVEAVMFIITLISFFISSWFRSEKEFIVIGIGSLLVLLGRNLLLNADTWISPIPGSLALAAGTWFICTRLHKVYLWL